MKRAETSRTSCPFPSPARPRRLGLVVPAVLLLCLSGCLTYTADIRVARNGAVQVRERVVVDAQWKESIGDTLQAAEKVLLRYKAEAKERGGKVVASGGDSVVAEFRYPTLAAFARAWPDSTDEDQQWDRSLYRRREEGGRAVDELILWRTWPPDPTPEGAPPRRYPVFVFWVTPPQPPVHHNAHVVRDGSYGWRFTEKMTAPDSVWIVWPATEK